MSGNPKQTTKEGFSALSKLQSLREFHFFKSPACMMSEPWLTKLLLMCFELIPQLHAVSPSNPEPHIVCKDLMQKLGTSTEKALSIYRVVPVNLRRLVLSGSFSYGIREYLNVPALSELALYGVSSEDLMFILGREGRNLTSLRLKLSRVVRINRLLRDCPNLIELSVDCRGFSDWSLLQPYTLQRLQVLQLKFEEDYSLNELYFTSEHMLPALLRLATKLRSFSIFFDIYCQQTLTELVLLTKQRTCMRHLEELKVSILDNLNVGEDEKIIKFCDTYIIECDQLKNVRLEFIDIEDAGAINLLIDH